MKCAHCGMSATEKGFEMPEKIWKECIQVAAEYGECLSLGGGEPTLHKQFIEILCYANAKSDDIPPWLATNGTNHARLLMKLAKVGAINVRFSIDQYHDTEMIDPEILYEIMKTDRSWEVSEIRTSNINVGRAKSLNDGVKKLDDECICDCLFVTPKGKVKFCGCPNAPIITDYRSLGDFIQCHAEIVNDSNVECWNKLSESDKNKIIERFK